MLFLPHPQHEPDVNSPDVWISGAGNPGISVNDLDPLVVEGEKKGKKSKKKSAALTEDEPALDTSESSARTQEMTKIKIQDRVGWAEVSLFHFFFLRALSRQMCGRRPDQQDTLSLYWSYRNHPERVLLAVFDGHSGEKSAMLVASQYSSLFRAFLVHSCRSYYNVLTRRYRCAEEGIVLADDVAAEEKRRREFGTSCPLLLVTRH